MKAVVYQQYGPPDVLQLQEVDPPIVPDDGLRVRVHAAALNAMDWYFLSGKPYFARMITGLARPKRTVLCVDFAGTVESVGRSVTQFRPGDEVFGAAQGTLAEVACTTERRIAPKPANLTFEQAAAVPVAGLTALQGLRDWGMIRPGQRVLINGASGGVGTFAVQIAKSFGAEVTCVCSTKHVDLVRSMGADQVMDYTREDFTRSGQRHDLMFDVAGNRSWSECRRVLNPKATYVLAGGQAKANRWTGPLGHLVRVRLASMGASQKVVLFVAKVNRQDLEVLKGLIEAGKVTPAIDGQYRLGDAAGAFRHFAEGHPRGKVVVTV